MPKMKTKKAAAKRFRVGGKGRISRKIAFARHNTGKKNGKFSRQHRGNKTVDKAEQDRVQRMFPYIAKMD